MTHSDPIPPATERRAPVLDRLAASGRAVAVVRPAGFGKTSMLDAVQRYLDSGTHRYRRTLRFDMRELAGAGTYLLAARLNPKRLTRDITLTRHRNSATAPPVVLIDDCNAVASDPEAARLLRNFFRALADNMPRLGAVILTDSHAPHSLIYEAMGGCLTDADTDPGYAQLCGLTRAEADTLCPGAWERCGGYRYLPDAEPVAPAGPCCSALRGATDPMGEWLPAIPDTDMAYAAAAAITREGGIVASGATAPAVRELTEAGYLTIAGADPSFGIVRHTFPNAGAERAFYSRLLRPAVPDPLPYAAIRHAFFSGEPDAALRHLQAILGAMPYIMTRCHSEADYQTLLFDALRLAGLDATAEAATSGGRIDIEVSTPDYIYIIELKRDLSPQKALRQISAKGYADRRGTDPRRVIAIGIEFSSASANMRRWLIESEGKEVRS